jgi:hypothetical protein
LQNSAAQTVGAFAQWCDIVTPASDMPSTLLPPCRYCFLRNGWLSMIDDSHPPVSQRGHQHFRCIRKGAIGVIGVSVVLSIPMLENTVSSPLSTSLPQPGLHNLMASWCPLLASRPHLSMSAALGHQVPASGIPESSSQRHCHAMIPSHQLFFDASSFRHVYLQGPAASFASQR